MDDYPGTFLDQDEYEAGKKDIVLPADLSPGLFDLNLINTEHNAAKYDAFAFKLLVDIVTVELCDEGAKFCWKMVNEEDPVVTESRHKFLTVRDDGLLGATKEVRTMGLRKRTTFHELGYISVLNFDMNELLLEERSSLQQPMSLA